MSYDPRNINQMYEQYGRTHGGSSNKGSTYDETPQTITRGLGTPLGRSFSTRDDDDDKKEDVGGVRSFFNDVFSLFTSSGAEPKEPPSFEGSSVYERKEFKPITYDPTENRITVTGYNPNTAMRSSDEIMGDVDAMLDRSQAAGYISRPGIYDEVKEQDRPPTTIEDAINTAIENTIPTAGYKVKKGDTLSEIAQATGRSVRELKQLNDITDPRRMQAGSTLKIPVQTAQDIEVVEGARSMSELRPLRRANQSMMTGDQRDYAPEDTSGFGGMGPDPSTGRGIMSPTSNQTTSNVDFDFISEQEGAAINTAYVPQDNDGNPEGQSGVTVGTGIDLGSKDREYFAGLDEDLVEKLEPYFGQKRENAQTILAISPLILTDSEVEELDRFVKDKELETLKNRWNQDSTTDFDDLPTNQATAVASVFYQYGPQMFTHNYWDQTTSGDWTAARNNLRDYGDRYNSRRNREATYLESGEM